MKISDSKFVTVTYDLYVGEGDERELMESATAERPLDFIFGTNSMIKAFEDNLFGLTVGESFKFSLSQDEAYGDYDDSRILDLPINIFEVDGKIDEGMLFEGNTLPMMDTEGNRLMGSIVSITDTEVTMDFNHPLAGETLHFEGAVMGIREANAEEIAALTSDHGCDCSSGGCGCSGEHDHDHDHDHHHNHHNHGCGGGCSC